MAQHCIKGKRIRRVCIPKEYDICLCQMTQFLPELSCIKRVNVCILRQMVSHDIVKNTVYAKDRSKCLPLADDGAGYK